VTKLENLVSSFGLLLLLALNVFRNVIFSGVISARDASLIILNVSLVEVCIFLTFLAGIARQISSFEFLCPMSATSAMSEVAYFVAQIRFSAASVLALSILLWEYVNAIGLFGFWMK